MCVWSPYLDQLDGPGMLVGQLIFILQKPQTNTHTHQLQRGNIVLRFFSETAVSGAKKKKSHGKERLETAEKKWEVLFLVVVTQAGRQ